MQSLTGLDDLDREQINYRIQDYLSDRDLAVEECEVLTRIDHQSWDFQDTEIDHSKIMNAPGADSDTD